MVKARKANVTKKAPAPSSSVRWIVRLLIGLWAAFWTYFLGANLLDAFKAPLSPERTKGLIYSGAGILVVLGIAWLAFSGKRMAAPMLLMLGTIIMIGYYVSGPSQMSTGNKILTAVELGLPLFAAGCLLVWGRRK